MQKILLTLIISLTCWQHTYADRSVFAGIAADAASVATQSAMNTFFTKMASNASVLNGLFTSGTTTAPALATVAGTIGTTGSLVPVIAGTGSGTRAARLMSAGNQLKGSMRLNDNGIELNSGNAWISLDLAETLNGPIRIKGDCRLTVSSDLYVTSTVNTPFMNSGSAGARTVTWKTSGTHTMHLGSNMSLTTTCTHKLDSSAVSLIIDGHGHILTFTDLSSVLDANGGIITLKNMTVNGLHNATQLVSSATGGQINFQNCVINIPTGTTVKLNNTTGSGVLNIKIYDDVVVAGGGTLEVTGGASQYATLQIQAQARLAIETGTTLLYDPTDGTRSGRITFSDATAQLYLHGSTLAAPNSGGANGLLLSTGSLIFDGTVTLTNGSGIVTTDDLAFASSLTKIIIPGASVLKTTGSVVTYL